MPRAALAALLTLAAVGPSPATQPDVDSGSPLIRFVATLDAASPPFAAQRLGDLRAAENALERNPGPTADCAQSLGATRHGALQAAVAFARQGVGDRSGAIAAWQRALDCEPRNARYRVALAGVLLTFGRLAEARAQADRALRLAPRQSGLDELQARLDFVAGRWPDAARRAQQIAAKLRRETATTEAGGTNSDTAGADDRHGAADVDPGPGPGNGSEAAAFWQLLALLAQRRGGLPPQDLPGPDTALEDRWPVPLWRLLVGETDERGLVAAIEAQDEALHRREMACEALYYTAQQAFASGRPETGRRRLARLVNLKILYYVEHDMALAELSTLRTP